MPSNPLGEIKIIKRWDTTDTGGNCLDLDVDIIDNVLVAVANYNGYFIYKINSINGIVSDISEQKHVGANEMDNSLGDNRAQSVILSKEHNIAFVMDHIFHRPPLTGPIYLINCDQSMYLRTEMIIYLRILAYLFY